MPLDYDFYKLAQKTTETRDLDALVKFKMPLSEDQWHEVISWNSYYSARPIFLSQNLDLISGFKQLLSAEQWHEALSYRRYEVDEIISTHDLHKIERFKQLLTDQQWHKAISQHSYSAVRKIISTHDLDKIERFKQLLTDQHWHEVVRENSYFIQNIIREIVSKYELSSMIRLKQLFPEQEWHEALSSWSGGEVVCRVISTYDLSLISEFKLLISEHTWHNAVSLDNYLVVREIMSSQALRLINRFKQFLSDQEWNAALSWNGYSIVWGKSKQDLNWISGFRRLLSEKEWHEAVSWKNYAAVREIMSSHDLKLIAALKQLLSTKQWQEALSAEKYSVLVEKTKHDIKVIKGFKTLFSDQEWHKFVSHDDYALVKQVISTRDLGRIRKFKQVLSEQEWHEAVSMAPKGVVHQLAWNYDQAYVNGFTQLLSRWQIMNVALVHPSILLNVFHNLPIYRSAMLQFEMITTQAQKLINTLKAFKRNDQGLYEWMRASGYATSIYDGKKFQATMKALPAEVRAGELQGVVRYITTAKDMKAHPLTLDTIFTFFPTHLRSGLIPTLCTGPERAIALGIHDVALNHLNPKRFYVGGHLLTDQGRYLNALVAARGFKIDLIQARLFDLFRLLPKKWLPEMKLEVLKYLPEGWWPGVELEILKYRPLPTGRHYKKVVLPPNIISAHDITSAERAVVAYQAYPNRRGLYPKLLSLSDAALAKIVVLQRIAIVYDPSVSLLKDWGFKGAALNIKRPIIVAMGLTGFAALMLAGAPPIIYIGSELSALTLLISTTMPTQGLFSQFIQGILSAIVITPGMIIFTIEGAALNIQPDVIATTALIGSVALMLAYANLMIIEGSLLSTATLLLIAGMSERGLLGQFMQGLSGQFIQGVLSTGVTIPGMIGTIKAAAMYGAKALAPAALLVTLDVTFQFMNWGVETPEDHLWIPKFISVLALSGVLLAGKPVLGAISIAHITHAATKALLPTAAAEALNDFVKAASYCHKPESCDSDWFAGNRDECHQFKVCTTVMSGFSTVHNVIQGAISLLDEPLKLLGLVEHSNTDVTSA